MILYVYTDSSFRKTHWFAYIFRGITGAAEKRRYRLVLLNEAPRRAEDIAGNGTRPVIIVVGNSAAALGEPLRQMWDAGIHTVLVNFTADIPSPHASVITMDYADAVIQGIRALRGGGRTRTALFGIYPDSRPDSIKRMSFLSEMSRLGVKAPEADVFTVSGDLGTCLSDFLPVSGRYDSVICGNDLAAVALNRALGERSGQIALAGFVDRGLSDFSVLVPGVLMLSAEHREFGRQAVKLCSWLQRNDTEVSVTVRVPMTASDGRDAEIGESGEAASLESLPGDPLVNEILRVERCLSLCDRIDIRILRGICGKQTRAAVAESVFISERAVGYRLKKLCAAVGCGDTAALAALIGPWIAGGKS